MGPPHGAGEENNFERGGVGKRGEVEKKESNADQRTEVIKVIKIKQETKA